MRVAIVTGASRGLGLALTAGLVAEGWTVIGDGRDAPALRDAFAGLGASTGAGPVPPAPSHAGRMKSSRGSRRGSPCPGNAVAVPGDVTNGEHRRALVAEARRRGGLELLVNNASLLGPSPQPGLADYPLEALRRVFEVNVIAPLALAQACLPELVVGGGTIVNITSDAAVEGYEGWGGYGSSKAALEQLSNVLAAEHPDLAIYWVDPGDMNTQMHQEAYPGEDISDRAPPADSVPGLIRLIAERPPAGRYRAREAQVSR